MSCDRRSFTCFKAVGEENPHKYSIPFTHHTAWLPRIHHDLEQDCHLCCRYGRAAESQLLPFYHGRPPYHQHHQYGLRGPSGAEEGHHSHHHRSNKSVVLVKNSDPSVRKSILLHRSGLRSLGLFLEEVSELMHYHIRKLYTREGCKIDSVQSLLQSPGVLICVGREPTHPAILENFQKTSSDKLPKLSGTSCTTGCSGGREVNQGLTANSSIIPPNNVCDNKLFKQSISTGKSVPDRRDSADIVDSRSITGNSLREDDIEKRVRVNKDGSLSMEMNVRFRLQNDETLHWSTKVRKTSGGTCNSLLGHGSSYAAQVSDMSCSESEQVSADEAYLAQHYQGNTKAHRCPRCYTDCQDYDIWKNVPVTPHTSCGIHTSSSSASSHTVVSRKTVVERQTVSRSSEELTEHGVARQTCETQTIEEAEMVEFCRIQEENCSHECDMASSTLKAAKAVDLFENPHIVTESIESKQLESETNSAKRAEKHDKKKQTVVSDVLEKSSRHISKPKSSKPSYACHCGGSARRHDKAKENTTEEEVEMERNHFSAKKSNSNHKALKYEETESEECMEEGGSSDSAKPVGSNRLDLEAVGEQRTSSCMSEKSMRSGATHEPPNIEEFVEAERVSSCLSMKSEASFKSQRSGGFYVLGENHAQDDHGQRTPSVMSALSSVSAELKLIAYEASDEECNPHSAQEEYETELKPRSITSEKSVSRKSRRSYKVPAEENQEDNQDESKERDKGSRSVSVRSVRSNERTNSPISYKSHVSVSSRNSKTPEVQNAGMSDQRPQSILSDKSERTVRSNVSTKSNKSNTSHVPQEKSAEIFENGRNGCIEETLHFPEARVSSAASEKSTRSKSSVRSTNLYVCAHDGVNKDGVTAERAGSALSSKSNASVVSVKSKDSCMSTNQNCDVHNEDYGEDKAGRSSCLSNESLRSNCTATSNVTASNNKDRGPSVLSVRSEVSNISARSNVSSSGDTSAVYQTEHKERAPSNMSIGSVRSSKSNVATADEACVPVEFSCEASEGQTERRSVSSMSVQSVKSNTSRSRRSNCSAAEETETPPSDNEESVTESRSARIPVELQQERALSSADAPSENSDVSAKSTNSNCSHVRTNEEPDKASSGKPNYSNETPPKTSPNSSNDEKRPPSSLSAKSMQSHVSEISINSTDRSKSALSAKSAKSHDSTKSAKSNVSLSENCKGDERPTSSQSVKSNVSARSNKSKCLTDTLEESIVITEVVHPEGRPSSSLSVKSTQSCDSEISIKSSEISQSALSAKSTKSHVSVKSEKTSVSEACSDETSIESNNNVHMQERADCALSSKTARSASSTRSTKTNEIKDPEEKNNSEGEAHPERTPSNLSVKSVKSTKSTVSTSCKKSQVSEVCLDDQLDTPEGRTIDEGIEDKPKCYHLEMSNELKCSSDYPVKDKSSISHEENGKEARENDRPQSSTSTKSVQSSISKASVKSSETTTSALSAKTARSHTSVISVKTNVSDTLSKRSAHDVNEDVEERTPSVMSVESTKSTVSAKSSKSARMDDEKHTERAPSNLSVKSEKSNLSTRSKISKVYEAPAEEDFCNNERRNNEGDHGDAVSLVSSHSVESECPAKDCFETTENNERPSKTPRSSVSSETVFSNASERCLKSADRSQSALSSKSAKSDTSAKSTVSVVSTAESPITEIAEKNDRAGKAQERTDTVESATSSDSAEVKRHDCAKEDWGCSEGTKSNMSVRSTVSVKSVDSTISKASKSSDIPHQHEDVQNDTQKEDNIESSSISSMSSKSIYSECQTKCGFSTKVPGQENIRPNSQASCSSQGTADTNDTKGGHDGASNYDRSGSALSAKSQTSTKSKKSKASSCLVEESSDDPNQVKRPISTLSTKSAKSNISGAYTHPVDDAAITNSENSARSNSLSSQTNISSKQSDAEVQSFESACEDNSAEKTEERAESPLSVKTACSHSSVRSSKSQASGDVTDNVDEHESSSEKLNSLSGARSERSVKTSCSDISDVSIKESQTKFESSPDKAESPASVSSSSNSESGNGNRKQNTERAPSTISVKSTKSSHTHISVQSGTTQASNLEDTDHRADSSSVISVNSEHSVHSGRSKKSQTSQTNVDTGRNAISPVSAKSVKTNVTSASKKSKSSHGSERLRSSKVLDQKAKQEGETQRTPSVLSLKSNMSSRTTESETSGLTHSKTSDKNSLVTAKELLDNLNDGDTSEKSETTLSVMSVNSNTSAKSKNSKACLIPVEVLSAKERSIKSVSAKSSQSNVLSRTEVPFVTVDESEARSNTITSSKSKKSKTSKRQDKKYDGNSQSSLSVHSCVSDKPKKSNSHTLSTVSVASKNAEERSAPCEEANKDEQIKGKREPVLCCTESKESDLSQTLSSSDLMKENCETSAAEESNASKLITNVHMGEEDNGRNKTDERVSETFKLVPSILPNASPTEVVNEWLKTLPAEGDIYEMEELNGTSDDSKGNAGDKKVNGVEDIDKKEEFESENSKAADETNATINDCKLNAETPNEDGSCTQRENVSKMFDSTIQVMKVLLSPKLERCNSLPEISPVFGRKLSTSAKGFLDCLVKLQLIDHDPKNVNEKNERYQELMSILQSLWLSDPPAMDCVQNKRDEHSVDGEYNHTSSSGVDVNSGSTGSGNSSDGVKSSDGVNQGISQPQTTAGFTMTSHNQIQKTDKWMLEKEEKQDDDDPGTDETIRNNDSPRETLETPSTSKSSGESSRNATNLTDETDCKYVDMSLRKLMEQMDPDPVWVLTLLTKIENQFMTHYINAMKEFTARWNLGENAQLEIMIDELKTEVQNRIQTSIDREVRKIQSRVGLPKPPKERTTTGSTQLTLDRRRRKHHSQAEESESSVTETSYSDQRSENIDENCPCEACIKKNLTSREPHSAEIRKTAPVAMDYDLKMILLTKNAITTNLLPCTERKSKLENETKAVETLVEGVIIEAVKEIQGDTCQDDVQEEETTELEISTITDTPVKEQSTQIEDTEVEESNEKEEIPSTEMLQNCVNETKNLIQVVKETPVLRKNDSEGEESDDPVVEIEDSMTSKVKFAEPTSEEDGNWEAMIDDEATKKVTCSENQDVCAKDSEIISCENEIMDKQVAKEELMSEFAEELTECELDEVKETENEAVEETCGKEQVDEAGRVSPVSAGDSLDENSDISTSDESSVEMGKSDPTAEEMAVEKQSTTAAEDEFDDKSEKDKNAMVTRSNQESDDEVDLRSEETEAPSEAEDKNDPVEPWKATSEQESENDESTAQRLPSTSAYESTDENSHSETAEESPEDDAERTSEQEAAVDAENKSKCEFCQKESSADETLAVGNVPDGEISAVCSESVSVKDLSEDDTSEDDDATSSELSEEQAENVAGHEQTEGRPTPAEDQHESEASGTENSEHEVEEVPAANGGVKMSEFESAKDVVEEAANEDDTSEGKDDSCNEDSEEEETEGRSTKSADEHKAESLDRGDSEEESQKVQAAKEEASSEAATESDEDGTERDSENEATEEGSSARATDSEEETATATQNLTEDELKYQQAANEPEENEKTSVDGATTEESESGESLDNSSNEESSVVEQKEEFIKSEETEPESTLEENAKMESGNVSDEDADDSESVSRLNENTSELDADDTESASKLNAEVCKMTEQEDTRSVKSNESEDVSQVVPHDSTIDEATDEDGSTSEVDSVEVLSPKENDGTESSEHEEGGSDLKEDKNEDESNTEEHEGRQSPSEEDSSENVNRSHSMEMTTEENETENHRSAEESCESPMVSSDGTESERGENDVSESCGDSEREENTDNSQNESVKDPEWRLKAVQDSTDAGKESEGFHSNSERRSDNENLEDSEKEDMKTAGVEQRGNLGDSADGEDEAEDDSDEQEECKEDADTLPVISHPEILAESHRDDKQALLIPLDSLMKGRVESEDGAYADIEDSEPEISQDVTSHK